MKKILLVDPDTDVCRILSTVLTKRLSAEVTIAHTSQDAVSLADDSRPDIVVLELALPEHNGIAFLHEFRSYADWLDVPVVIHTHLARNDVFLPEEAKNLGVTDYLYKPQTPLDVFVKTISHRLESL